MIEDILKLSETWRNELKRTMHDFLVKQVNAKYRYLSVEEKRKAVEVLKERAIMFNDTFTVAHFDFLNKNQKQAKAFILNKFEYFTDEQVDCVLNEVFEHEFVKQAKLDYEEKVRLEREKMEQERLVKEEQERLKQERMEQERLINEEQERLKQERMEQERLINEEREKLEREEQERKNMEQKERERKEMEQKTQKELKEQKYKRNETIIVWCGIIFTCLVIYYAIKI